MSSYGFKASSEMHICMTSIRQWLYEKWPTFSSGFRITTADLVTSGRYLPKHPCCSTAHNTSSTSRFITMTRTSQICCCAGAPVVAPRGHQLSFANHRRMWAWSSLNCIGIRTEQPQYTQLQCTASERRICCIYRLALLKTSDNVRTGLSALDIVIAVPNIPQTAVTPPLISSVIQSTWLACCASA